MLDNPQMTVRESQFHLGDESTAVDPSTDELTLRNNVCDGNTPSTAGVGTIQGSYKWVVGGIDPRDVPAIDRHCEFHRARTHSSGM